MAKPITLSNGREWKTKSAAQAHFKAMLAKYCNEAVVDDLADHEDLVSLLERYDEVITEGPTKAGCGIECFFRRLNRGEGWTTPSFWVRRTDGSETDWSYRQAIDGQPMTRSAEFYGACREAVAADLVQAKRLFFKEYGDADGKVLCELSNALMTLDDAHVDHAYHTFNHLVLGFRAANGWSRNIPDGVLTPPADAQVRTLFVDPAMAEAFRQYHHQLAKLRVIHKTANLSMAARQRLPNIKNPVKLPL